MRDGLFRNKLNMHAITLKLWKKSSTEAMKSPVPLPPGSSSLCLSQADKLAVNLLWHAVLSDHSNSVFRYIHRQCLDSSTPPLISQRLQAPFCSHKFFSFSSPKTHLDRCLINTSVMYISDFKAALSISTCHLIYLTPSVKKGLWNSQLVSLLICSYYMHQKARGLKPLDSLTNPSHFIKYMMIKSCVCFQRSCEARWGGPHSEAPARCTQSSAKHLVPFISESGASASLSLFPEAVNNLWKTHLTPNGRKRR